MAQRKGAPPALSPDKFTTPRLIIVLIALLAALFDHYGIVPLSSQAQFFCVLFAAMGGVVIAVGLIAIAIMMNRGVL